MENSFLEKYIHFKRQSDEIWNEYCNLNKTDRSAWLEKFKKKKIMKVGCMTDVELVDECDDYMLPSAALVKRTSYPFSIYDNELIPGEKVARCIYVIVYSYYDEKFVKRIRTYDVMKTDIEPKLIGIREDDSGNTIITVAYCNYYNTNRDKKYGIDTITINREKLEKIRKATPAKLLPPIREMTFVS